MRNTRVPLGRKEGEGGRINLRGMLFALIRAVAMKHGSMFRTEQFA